MLQFIPYEEIYTWNMCCGMQHKQPVEILIKQQFCLCLYVGKLYRKPFGEQNSLFRAACSIALRSASIATLGVYIFRKISI